MKKFWLLVKRGLSSRIKKKSFIISNIVIVIFLMILLNLPAIISLFSNDEPEYKVLVYSEVNDFDVIDDFLGLPDLFGDTEISFVLQTDTPVLTADEVWKLEGYNGYITFISPGPMIDADITFYNNFDSMMVSQTIQVLLSQAIATSQGITNYVEVVRPDSGGLSPETGMIISALSSLPLFIFVIMSVQMLGVDIVDEKSSKAIEIIIASVPAKTHFLAKITSVVLFVIIQALLMLGFGAIGNLISGATLSAVTGGLNTSTTLGLLGSTFTNLNIPILFLSVILFVIIGTISYLVIAAFVASFAVTQEDFSQIQAPIMIFMVLGFYLALYAPMMGEVAYPFIRIASYIPFLSPFVAVGAYGLGVLAFYEVAISFLVSTLTAVGLIFLIAPIYKISILSYDSGRLFSRIRKAYTKSKTV